jgi:hypothetical protein
VGGAALGIAVCVFGGCEAAAVYIGGTTLGGTLLANLQSCSTTLPTLEDLASDSGAATTFVATTLDSEPDAARALSVGIGDNAAALAGQAGGGTLYTGNIPTALIDRLEAMNLAIRSTTAMGGTTGTEIKFLPGATQYIVRYLQEH